MQEKRHDNSCQGKCTPPAAHSAFPWARKHCPSHESTAGLLTQPAQHKGSNGNTTTGPQRASAFRSLHAAKARPLADSAVKQPTAQGAVSPTPRQGRNSMITKKCAQAIIGVVAKRKSITSLTVTLSQPLSSTSRTRTQWAHAPPLSSASSTLDCTVPDGFVCHQLISRITGRSNQHNHCPRRARHKSAQSTYGDGLPHRPLAGP